MKVLGLKPVGDVVTIDVDGVSIVESDLASPTRTRDTPAHTLRVPITVDTRRIAGATRVRLELVKPRSKVAGDTTKAEAKDAILSTIADVITAVDVDLSTITPRRVRRVIATSQVGRRPVMSLSTTHVASEHDVSRRVSRSAIVKKLIDANIPPTQLTDVVRPTSYTTSTIISGITPKKGFKLFPISKDTVVLSKAMFDVVNISSTDQLASLVAPQVVTIDENVIKLAVDMRVPVDAVVDGASIVVRPADGSSMHVGVTTIDISVDDLVRAFLRPTTAPVVRAVSPPAASKVVIELTQLDERADAVDVYRRRAHTDDAYIFIGRVDIDTSSGMRRFIDEPPSSSTWLYRFIPVNSTASIASNAFSDVVVKMTTPVSLRTPGRVVDESSTSLVVDDDDLGAVVKLVNVPPEVVAVRMRRRVVYPRPGEWEYVTETSTSNTTTVVVSTSDDVTFVDAVPDVFHVYEYSPEYIIRDGSEVPSKTTSLYRRTFQLDDIEVTTTVGQPRVDIRSNGVGDVTFSIRSTIEDDFTSLIEVLDRMGLSDVFAVDIAENRESLARLIAHRVVRIDMTTGTRYDLGVITGDVFVDSSARRRTGAPPPTPGVHRYEVTPLVVNPYVLLENTKLKRRSKTKLTAPYTTPEASQREYEVDASKWLHPVTLRWGTVTTRTTRSTSIPTNEFSLGEIPGVKIVEVDIPKVVNALTSLNATRIADNVVRVSWTYTGDASTVDHFVVEMTSSTGRSTVAHVHALNDTNSIDVDIDLDDVGVDVDVGEVAVAMIDVSFDEVTRRSTTL